MEKCGNLRRKNSALSSVLKLPFLFMPVPLLSSSSCRIRVIKMRCILCQLFLMALLLTLVSGCATTMQYTKYNEAISKNTPQAYKQFAKEYPNSPLSADFVKRTNDPDYAFIATCQIGTKKAFKEFINSYPSSVYVPISKVRIKYLAKIDIQKHIYDYYFKPNSKFLKLNEQYISEHPENPFVVESKVRFPILWLKESVNGKIGVVIKVSNLVKGALLKHRNVEKVRQDIFHKVKGLLDSEGIESVFIDGSESHDELKDINTTIVVYYSEKPPTGFDVGTASQTAVLVFSSAALYDAVAAIAASGPLVIIGLPGALLVGVIAGAFSNPVKRLFGVRNKYIWIDIKGSKNNVKYYSSAHSLSSMYREVNIQQLKAIKWHYDPLQYMVMVLDRQIVGLSIYSDLLKSLPIKGAEVNAKSKNEETNLIIASLYNDSGVVESLLSKGADVNAKAVTGVTPLMWASFNGSEKIANALLTKGANVNAQGKNGETALIIASGFGFSGIVNALLNRGADVNAKNKDGETALMGASWNGHSEVVKILKEAGAKE